MLPASGDLPINSTHSLRALLRSSFGGLHSCYSVLLSMIRQMCRAKQGQLCEQTRRHPTGLTYR